MFELDAIDDLVVPRSASTTGRALASMARRRTFEQLKLLARDGHPDAALVELVDELARAFARRLPGDPHSISEAITDPAVGVPLRLGLGQGNTSSLAIGIGRLLTALGDRPASEPEARRFAVSLATTLRVGDIELAAAARIAESRALSPARSVDALREAVDQLGVRSPALRADLDRFGVALIVSPTPASALAVHTIGLAIVPDTDDVPRLLEGLVASIAVGKLNALADGRAHDADLLRRLRPLVADAAVRFGLPAPTEPRTSASPPAPDAHGSALAAAPSDPLRHVVAELHARSDSGSIPP